MRAIRDLVDEALGKLSAAFARLYAREGRPSIPPERLLRALLLQAFYTVRSERQLMEQLDYNLLFRSSSSPLPPTISFASQKFWQRQDKSVWSTGNDTLSSKYQARRRQSAIIEFTDNKWPALTTRNPRPQMTIFQQPARGARRKFLSPRALLGGGARQAARAGFCCGSRRRARPRREPCGPAARTRSRSARPR